VTVTDRRVNDLIVELIHKLFPGFQIVSEEADEVAGNAHRIYIDPIDGTMNFVHGFREVAISIGYWHEGAPKVGVVYNPFTDELFSAVAGSGATLNDRPVTPSGAGALDECLVGSGWPYDKDSVPEAARVMGSVCRSVREVRTIGSAALAICYVAAGVFDGFWEWTLEPWDLAAAAAIAVEAGATVTTAQGENFSLESPSVAAATPFIHGPLVDVVNQGTPSLRR
jgi:myo-inositol-1(or 4)-monophosphatase